ncbi:hypothetical protein [Segetibacter koreensis]|uniref:hypothetical protein n=1 Tax=Segetibacter koreensis TaxID=398037 RepID=UPI00146BE42B|nr:hypothetical protein [Segetibacter koreensis]
MKNTSANDRARSKGLSAIVNLDHMLLNYDFGRYSYIICLYLNYFGFNIIVKTNYKFFKSLEPFKKLFIKQQYRLIRNSSTPINTITLNGEQYVGKLININYGYSSIKNKAFDCIAPYPMFPLDIQFFCNSEYLLRLREAKRTIKIFFSGNVNRSLFSQEHMRKEFDVLPRWDVINFIKTTFEAKSKIQVIKDKSFLYELFDADSYTNSIIISEARTAKIDWLKMLSKTDFFICPPGVSAPWCHNSIEAMSVGTIPILQYADLFTPVLEDKKNCLVFKNYNELQKVMDDVLEMKKEEIEIMRHNVIDYYQKYLSIESIGRKLHQFITSNKQETNLVIPFIRSFDDK